MTLIYDSAWLARIAREEKARHDQFKAELTAEKARRDLKAAGILPEYCWDHSGEEGLGGWKCGHPSHKAPDHIRCVCGADLWVVAGEEEYDLVYLRTPQGQEITHCPSCGTAMELEEWDFVDPADEVQE